MDQTTKDGVREEQGERANRRIHMHGDVKDKENKTEQETDCV